MTTEMVLVLAAIPASILIVWAFLTLWEGAAS